jgi:serine kinase of HPr protein (carbohydrate metabolism regulator)
VSEGVLNLHGVAVAAGEVGLLILGDSGSGKSSLAARMIADWPFGRVRLVADDRVLLGHAGGRLVARPHPAIAGRMEVRGIGIVEPPALDSMVLRLAVRLETVPPPRLPEAGLPTEEMLGIRLPCAWLPGGSAAYARLLSIWPYMMRCITMEQIAMRHLECRGAL